VAPGEQRADTFLAARRCKNRQGRALASQWHLAHGVFYTKNKPLTLESRKK
jgi:hypothetical protein